MNFFHSKTEQYFSRVNKEVEEIRIDAARSNFQSQLGESNFLMNEEKLLTIVDFLIAVDDQNFLFSDTILNKLCR